MVKTCKNIGYSKQSNKNVPIFSEFIHPEIYGMAIIYVFLVRIINITMDSHSMFIKTGVNDC